MNSRVLNSRATMVIRDKYAFIYQGINGDPMLIVFVVLNIVSFTADLYLILPGSCGRKKKRFREKRYAIQNVNANVRAGK